MRVRRCAVLFLESREDVDFDLESLLTGGAGLSRHQRWLALAAHLDAPVEVDSQERELLGRLSPSEWSAAESLEAAEESLLPNLIKRGLVLAEEEPDAPHRERDEALRAGHWWPAAAMMHRLARWEGVDSVSSMESNEMTTAADLRRKLGAPPIHALERVDAGERVALPRIDGNDFDAMLARRSTCRNFDSERPLSLPLFAHMMQRVFAAQSQVKVDEYTVFLKKNTPSGGGLHPTEAYLIVQNVEGLAPGLYHYHVVDHALEPLRTPDEPLEQFARRALAGQHWFSNAPAMAVLTPRYARSFWKYRQHAKAYRALVLDSGHLSQTLYLSATELGLGAFVTSAINEVDIERGFGLDPLVEGPLAICGFGWRAQTMSTSEFDPAQEVWLRTDEES
ncbi:putative peptide maturation dehydrogenase [Kribbella antibiotica]|uniref:Putative peptide maturation dehydrogenase n=1 Tax=Kribbella antibiotica TaxID=190195 RepID=A0A4R4YQ18_9ACTN|nr:putative peptide maturation dehydrogenase [Kribbella antibiotica]TDD47275.1 putative peptide maturation dehydrogenase [Kribbella antibiotica]